MKGKMFDRNISMQKEAKTSIIVWCSILTKTFYFNILDYNDNLPKRLETYNI